MLEYDMYFKSIKAYNKVEKYSLSAICKPSCTIKEKARLKRNDLKYNSIGGSISLKELALFRRKFHFNFLKEALNK